MDVLCGRSVGRFVTDAVLGRRDWSSVAGFSWSGFATDNCYRLHKSLAALRDLQSNRFLGIHHF